jgi:hypothetical protein
VERRDRIVIGSFVVTLVATCAVVVAVIATQRDTSDSVAQPLPVEPGCVAQVRRGVLPVWARTGFSEPEPRMPHVVGDHGRLVAILFGDPLVGPPARDRSNKILWVARRTPEPGPLRLVADDGERQVRRVVDSGPGPSIVDLPAGCWSVTASWNGGEDVLDLSYEAR